MKIIYLSPNMGRYTAAHYQQDVVDELAIQHQVYMYGPGYDLYAQIDTISDVVAKSPFDRPKIKKINYIPMLLKALFKSNHRTIHQGTL